MPRLTPFALALLVAAAGCAPRATDELADDDARRLARLSARIDAEIGEARASRSNQCRVLPLGVKPCGGPREFRAYAVAGTDEPRLEALAAEYAALDRARNERLGLSSDCAAEAPPPVGLDGGRCVLRAREP